jgi:hypothetical protein
MVTPEELANKDEDGPAICFDNLQGKWQEHHVWMKITDL